MSFLRHWEIYQVSESNSGDRELKGRDLAATPVAHQLDESPVGYSLAGCSPAEPASASPTEATLQQCRGELQEGIGWNLDPTLTRGLTLGAHPNCLSTTYTEQLRDLLRWRPCLNNHQLRGWDLGTS